MIGDEFMKKLDSLADMMLVLANKAILLVNRDNRYISEADLNKEFHILRNESPDDDDPGADGKGDDK
jgi:hypothetical protein